MHSIKSNDDHVFIKFENEPPVSEVIEIMAKIRVECKENNLKKILADLQKYKKPAIKDDLRLKTFVGMLKLGNSAYKVAAYGRKEIIDPLIAATENLNSGPTIKFFESEEEAKKWLKKK